MGQLACTPVAKASWSRLSQSTLQSLGMDFVSTHISLVLAFLVGIGFTVLN